MAAVIAEDGKTACNGRIGSILAAAVAQLVVAPDCGSGCRGFKSLQPPHPVFNDIWDFAIFVGQRRTIALRRAPNNAVFLECAQAARAHYLVTGNLKRFPMSWQGIRIVTPRWLLDNQPAGNLAG
jgi:hypothetical protein